VDIRIGITNSPREISFETSQTATEVEAVVADALDGGKSYVTLADSKGKTYLVPTASLAYVEVGSEENRRGRRRGEQHSSCVVRRQRVVGDEAQQRAPEHDEQELHVS
jgi:hypothetical protein